MHRVLISFFALLAAGAPTLFAQLIERMVPFQPVSITYVKVSTAYRGKAIDWRVMCTTIDEFSGDFAVVGDTVRATGDSVQVRLLKSDFKYTYYKVFPSSGTEKDSLELQVFSKGALQTYLHKIPVYPFRPVQVTLYLPQSFSPSSRILVAMHGTDRNAQNYALAWTQFATVNNTVVIAPRFDSGNWSSDSYLLGNMFTGSGGTGSLNMKEKWTFTIVKDIERVIARGFGLRDSSYTLWGHSAGGQFVHRWVLFAYDSLATTAIAANPGWYTTPDSTTAFPWGIKHPFLLVGLPELVQYTKRNLVIMRGTADTLRDSDLNVDSLSDVQGKNRFQRGGYFFQKGKEINPSLRWRLIDVPDVGHDYRKMATAAGEYLLKATTKVEREPDLLPRSIVLQNYPNPFNPTTAVSYQLSAVSLIRLAVYDALGREVASLVNETKSPGSYTVHWDATGLPSGMYFCRLTSERQSSTVKMLYLK